nr:MAG TPA: hypothetical protein [Caudoviricetes sp.]
MAVSFPSRFIASQENNAAFSASTRPTCFLPFLTCISKSFPGN